MERPPVRPLTFLPPSLCPSKFCGNCLSCLPHKSFPRDDKMPLSLSSLIQVVFRPHEDQVSGPSIPAALETPKEAFDYLLPLFFYCRCPLAPSHGGNFLTLFMDFFSRASSLTAPFPPHKRDPSPFLPPGTSLSPPEDQISQGPPVQSLSSVRVDFPKY